MTAYLGVQETVIAAGNNPPVNFVGGRVRVFNEQFVYAAQASGSTITVATIPAGAVPLFFVLNTDTSTGSATIAVGDGTTAALYGAAAAYTTTNTPTLIGKTATALTALTAQGSVVLTTAAAALPASGNLSFQSYYVQD
jgi:hypothetical protein